MNVNTISDWEDQYWEQKRAESNWRFKMMELDSLKWKVQKPLPKVRTTPMWFRWALFSIGILPTIAFVIFTYICPLTGWMWFMAFMGLIGYSFNYLFTWDKKYLDDMKECAGFMFMFGFMAIEFWHTYIKTGKFKSDY